MAQAAAAARAAVTVAGPGSLPVSRRATPTAGRGGAPLAAEAAAPAGPRTQSNSHWRDAVTAPGASRVTVMGLLADGPGGYRSRDKR